MLINTINILFYVYIAMLFGRILGSWVPELQQTKIMQFIAFYTDPYLNLFRKIIPPIGFLDISPILAFLALQIAHTIVLDLLR